VRLLQINLAPLEAREPPAAVVVRNGVINPCKTLPLAAGGTLSKTLRTGQGFTARRGPGAIGPGLGGFPRRHLLGISVNRGNDSPPALSRRKLSLLGLGKFE
jgi:hypothetical protein